MKTKRLILASIALLSLLAIGCSRTGAEKSTAEETPKNVTPTKPVAQNPEEPPQQKNPDDITKPLPIEDAKKIDGIKITIKNHDKLYFGRNVDDTADAICEASLKEQDPAHPELGVDKTCHIHIPEADIVNYDTAFDVMFNEPKCKNLEISPYGFNNFPEGYYYQPDCVDDTGKESMPPKCSPRINCLGPEISPFCYGGPISEAKGDGIALKSIIYLDAQLLHTEYTVSAPTKNWIHPEFGSYAMWVANWKMKENYPQMVPKRRGLQGKENYKFTCYNEAWDVILRMQVEIHDVNKVTFIDNVIDDFFDFLTLDAESIGWVQQFNHVGLNTHFTQGLYPGIMKKQ